MMSQAMSREVVDWLLDQISNTVDELPDYIVDALSDASGISTDEIKDRFAEHRDTGEVPRPGMI